MPACSRAVSLLARLGRRLPCADQRVAVVVAHPDDETLAVGAQLALLREVVLVHVTDGAPRDGADARALGFPSDEAYAAARRRELEAAVRVAGIGPDRLVGPWVADQEVALRVPEVTARLVGVLGQADVAITHAYEGGHPDHDAVALCVHLAAAACARPPALIEVPLYHAGPAGWVWGQFAAGPGSPGLVVALDRSERALKAQMLAAHRSQAAVLGSLPYDVERLRPAPAHDFTRLPNGGNVLYERYAWGMTASRWLDLAARDAA
jgi:N-acetylglucosamine malate deacetylase 2